MRLAQKKNIMQFSNYVIYLKDKFGYFQHFNLYLTLNPTMLSGIRFVVFIRTLKHLPYVPKEDGITKCPLFLLDE